MSGDLKTPLQHLKDGEISVDDLLLGDIEDKLVAVIRTAMLNVVIYYGTEIDKVHFLREIDN